MTKQEIYLMHRAQGAGVREAARKAGYAHGVPGDTARALDAVLLELDPAGDPVGLAEEAEARIVQLRRKVKELTDLRAGYLALARAGQMLGGLV